MERPGLPLWLPVIFIASVALAAILLLRSTRSKRTITIFAFVWLVVQGAIAASGFYLETDTLPPRMVLALAPPLLFIIGLFIVPQGRAWMDTLDLRALVFLHIVRIPVEIGLHMLYTNGRIPEVMTYEGRNFDIISGLTAPLVAFIAFRGRVLNRPLLIGWNLLCLGLLVNIVYHGVLSVPTPFQRFGFERPNAGLLYFPYVWLPAFIVPAVLLAHLASLRRLLQR